MNILSTGLTSLSLKEADGTCISLVDGERVGHPGSAHHPATGNKITTGSLFYPSHGGGNSMFNVSSSSSPVVGVVGVQHLSKNSTNRISEPCVGPSILTAKTSANNVAMTTTSTIMSTTTTNTTSRSIISDPVPISASSSAKLTHNSSNTSVSSHNSNSISTSHSRPKLLECDSSSCSTQTAAAHSLPIRTVYQPHLSTTTVTRHSFCDVDCLVAPPPVKCTYSILNSSSSANTISSLNIEEDYPFDSSSTFNTPTNSSYSAAAGIGSSLPTATTVLSSDRSSPRLSKSVSPQQHPQKLIFHDESPHLLLLEAFPYAASSSSTSPCSSLTSSKSENNIFDGTFATFNSIYDVVSLNDVNEASTSGMSFPSYAMNDLSKAQILNTISSTSSDLRLDKK